MYRMALNQPKYLQYFFCRHGEDFCGFRVNHPFLFFLYQKVAEEEGGRGIVEEGGEGGGGRGRGAPKFCLVMNLLPFFT
jgi:hypothetical protein